MLSYLLGIVVFHVLLGDGLFSKTPSRTYDNSDSTEMTQPRRKWCCVLVFAARRSRTRQTNYTRHVAEQLSKQVSPPSGATAVTAPVCPVFRVVVAGRYLVCRFN